MITIRPLLQEDLPTRVEWMNRPEVYQKMHFRVPVTLASTFCWYEKVRNNSRRVDFSFEDSHQRLVAMGGLTSINSVERPSAELYVFINPDAFHQGYGMKATTLLCQYGFNNLRLSMISLYTNENNKWAKTVYESLGFKLKDRFSENGVIRLYYELLCGEFRSLCV